MAEIPFGVYKIMSSINPDQVISVPGASVNAETYLKMYANNDTNAQRVLAIPFESPSGANSFIFMCSGMAMDVKGAIFKSENYVWQYPINNQSLAQSWEVIDTGRTTQHNGMNVPLYNIQTSGTAAGPDAEDKDLVTEEQAGTHYMLDVKSGRNDMAVDGTQVWIYRPNGTDAQNWIIMPDSILDSSLGSVSNLGWFMGDSSSNTSLIHAMPIIQATNGSTIDTVWPAFKGSASKYQIRYRFRYRKAKTDSWTQFSNWVSYIGQMQSDVNPYAEEGWTNSQSHMIDVNAVEGRLDSAIRNEYNIIHPFNGMQIELNPKASSNAYDKAEYEFEVRSFEKTYLHGFSDIPTHSNSVAMVLSACITPIVDAVVDNIKFTSSGLKIPYVSSFERGGNTVTISSIKLSGKTLCQGNKTYTFSDKPYSGDVLIPDSDFAILPIDGEKITFKLSITTCDGIKNSKWIEKSASRDSLHDFTITATQNVTKFTNNIDIKLSSGVVSSLVSKTCTLMYEHDGRQYKTLCEETDTGFRVYPPFNVDYSLYIVAEKPQGHWGDLMISKGKTVNGQGNIFSYNGIDVDLTVTSELNANPKRNASHSNSKYSFEGDYYESTFFGSVTESTLSLSAVVHNDKYQGPKYGLASLDAFRALCMHKYAVFRNTQGERYDVAITNWSEEPLYELGLWKVNINMNERAGVK